MVAHFDCPRLILVGSWCGISVVGAKVMQLHGEVDLVSEMSSILSTLPCWPLASQANILRVPGISGMLNQIQSSQTK